jgi:hypothetical protein
VSERWWLIASAAAVAGAVALGMLVHPFVGSGFTCEGLGFGCTPERLTDSALVSVVFGIAALGSLLVARWCARRGRRWRRALAAGTAVTAVATAAVVWSQLPRYPTSPGPLSEARDRWEGVLADGIAVASPGTPLGDALRGLQPRGPLPCRDAYRRDTGARALLWSSRTAYDGSSSGSPTAAALGRWAERLRARGVDARISDPGGDPSSDRRLEVGRPGPAAGGRLYVRASFYAAELEISAGTGCHME